MPILFLSLADLLAGAVMPYLSHDWESGAREKVSDRLNTVLKVTSFVMLAGGVAVMWIAPLLFHIAFEGRYDHAASYPAIVEAADPVLAAMRSDLASPISCPAAAG